MSGENYEHVKSARFNRKENSVEAMRVVNFSLESVAIWCGGDILQTKDVNSPVLVIPTTNGGVYALFTDWVVKTEDGKFHRLADSIFKSNYQFDKEKTKEVNGYS